MKNYNKVAEYQVASFPEADTLATKLFTPRGEKDGSGSRTTPEAKVRVRLQKGQHGQKDSFRVVEYLAISEVTPKAKLEDTAKVKNSTRHHNDKKGTRKKSKKLDATP